MEIVAWLIANWSVIAGALGALMTIISVVVALTPGTGDDAFWAKVLPFLSFLQPKDSVGTLKAPLSAPGPSVQPPPLMVERRDEDERDVGPRDR